jgi:hypothetical protein
MLRPTVPERVHSFGVTALHAMGFMIRSGPLKAAESVGRMPAGMLEESQVPETERGRPPFRTHPIQLTRIP